MTMSMGQNISGKRALYNCSRKQQHNRMDGWYILNGIYRSSFNIGYSFAYDLCVDFFYSCSPCSSSLSHGPAITYQHELTCLQTMETHLNCKGKRMPKKSMNKSVYCPITISIKCNEFQDECIHYSCVSDCD